MEQTQVFCWQKTEQQIIKSLEQSQRNELIQISSLNFQFPPDDVMSNQHPTAGPFCSLPTIGYSFSIISGGIVMLLLTRKYFDIKSVDSLKNGEFFIIFFSPPQTGSFKYLSSDCVLIIIYKAPPFSSSSTCRFWRTFRFDHLFGRVIHPSNPATSQRLSSSRR